MRPKLSVPFLQKTFPDGEVFDLEKEAILAFPHQRITHFYWLIEGGLDYLMTMDDADEDILVSEISEPFMPIGWAGFNAPHRFGLKIQVASEKVQLFKVALGTVQAHALSNPSLIKHICGKVYHQLGLNLRMQGKKLEVAPTQTAETAFENYYISPESSPQEIILLLRRSPFMEEFEETDLYRLAQMAERREYEAGEEVVEQDKMGEGFFIMIQGEVAIRRFEADSQVNMRSISTPGFLFGWACLFDQPDLLEGVTTVKTSVYFLSKAKLDAYLNNQQDFSAKFYKRLIWLIGNQLNVSLIRYFNLRVNHDLIAVRNLIHNTRSRLKLSSPLHQVPHLLATHQTRKSAFELLHNTNKHGSSLEKHLASISLDMLKDEAKELRFIEGLRYVYEEVAEQNMSCKPAEIRKKCAKATRKLFSELDYFIEGKENLPDDPGHIFIYNHLLNPTYYTLVNNFQITLDSHFISGLILDEKYGEPGIRTVRIGKGQEYGHQDYYERLGYINVYTKDSDTIGQAVKENARSIFYKEANRFLDQKMNLIISPEGTSFTTEESPGLFKTGAFRLALRRKAKTLIVPIVMCHFDRRITNNTFYCNVLPPIDVQSDINPDDEQEIRRVVEETQKMFYTAVRSAEKRVDSIRSKQVMHE